MEADFSGYATKAGLKCSDGRTIMPEAFKHMDGMTVPLVWQHGHTDAMNVLGHAKLEAREDGVYAYGFFNETDAGKHAKNMVQHGDITSLSIYANKLVERGKQVFHGVIRELSLVLSGANPGALIDNVRIAHSDDDIETLDDEAVIFTGLNLSLEHEDKGDTKDEDKGDATDEELEHATVREIYDSLSDEQKNVVDYMIGAALEAANTTATHSDSENDEENDQGDITHQEGTDDMSRNVFEQNGSTSTDEKHVLTHDAIRGIVASAERSGSLKAAVEEYALAHGIENIDILFPDAKAIDATPEWIKRRTEWVAGVLGNTRHTPFSRIKTRNADITHEEARAKGYIKGSLKKEEFFGVSQRTTTPTTVYKKQKLDRDDMIDITDFDVVAWLKGEMRLMLEEELARAILIGDGRDVADEDKIKDPVGAQDAAGIRSIINDHELYVTTVNVNLDDANSDYNEVVEAVMRARRFYKGTGTPAFYTTNQVMVEMLLSKDNFGRRRWNSKEELAAALMCSSVVEVEVMDDVPDVVGIIVNLQDYAVGADRGGDISMFDDFDIDYNQYKYLIETRVSGALTKVKSALVVRKVAGTAVLVAPAEPAFDGTAVTITDQTGVVYTNADTDAVINAAGSPYAVADGATLNVHAAPAAGYYFATDAEDDWSFTNPA